MKIREIQLGEDVESKKEAINTHLGKEAILQDATFGWVHVIINKPYEVIIFPTQREKETYSVKYLSGEGRNRDFYYNNLETMLVISAIISN